MSRCSWLHKEHAFVSIGDTPFKNQCSRCGHEEWLMFREYPRGDQTRSYWRQMHDPNNEIRRRNRKRKST